MKLNKFFFLFLSGLFFCSIGRAKVIDRIVATIGIDRGVVAGTAITRLQVIRRMRLMLRQGNLNPSGFDRKDVNNLFNKAMGNLVEDIIGNDVARKLGLSVSEQDVNKRILQMKQRNKWSDLQLLDMVKRMYGVATMSDFRSFLKKEMLKEQAIGMKVRSKVYVTDSEVRDMFLKRFKDGKLQPSVRLAHIVVPLPQRVTLEQVSKIVEKMRKIRKQIVLGKISFEDAARRFSQDSTAARGGVIGWYSYEELDPRIGSVVFALKKGNISNVVPGERGFHIFKVIDRKWTPLNNVKEMTARLKYDLFSERMKIRFSKWIERKKKNRHYEIRVKPEDLKVARFMLNLR